MDYDKKDAIYRRERAEREHKRTMAAVRFLLAVYAGAVVGWLVFGLPPIF